MKKVKPVKLSNKLIVRVGIFTPYLLGHELLEYTYGDHHVYTPRISEGLPSEPLSLDLDKIDINQLKEELITAVKSGSIYHYSHLTQILEIARDPIDKRSIPFFSTPKHKVQLITPDIITSMIRNDSIYNSDHGNPEKSKSEKLHDNLISIIVNPLICPKMIIIGNTKSNEEFTRDVTRANSDLLFARYSKFYGKPSGYTGTKSEDAGYSLDIPKNPEAVKALLTHEGFIDSLVTRNPEEIRDSIKDLNARLANTTYVEPVLVTARLEYTLKPKNYDND